MQDLRDDSLVGYSHGKWWGRRHDASWFSIGYDTVLEALLFSQYLDDKPEVLYLWDKLRLHYQREKSYMDANK